MITLGRIPLLLADTQGVLQAWLDRNFPFEDIRDQAESVSLCTNRPQSRSGYAPATGLPLPNYPDPPRPKLNSLYWPTGASRWARGYFLSTTGDKNQIVDSGYANHFTGQLTMTDETNSLAVTCQVHVLPPRPLPPGLLTTQEGYSGLWLIPVVDDRYFWQYRNTGNLVVTNSSTWSDLYSALGTALGVTITADTVSANYFRPDIQELTRRYENAAVLLDAVAHSCGHRIVRKLDGTVHAINAASSLTLFNTNSGDFESAGANLGAGFNYGKPASVAVTFPKYRQCQVDPNGDLLLLAGAESVGGQFEAVKTVHSTAFADFSNKNTDADNLTDCQTLANQITSDYIAWLSTQYDIAFASLKSWSLSGYDDHVEWCFGRVEPLKPSEQDRIRDSLAETADDLPWGMYQAYTRVQSPPYNFGDEEQLQNFPDMPVYPRLARVKLTANLDFGTNAAAKFVSDTTTGTTVTSDTLTVFDSISKVSAGIGTVIWAEYKSDTLRWETVGAPNLIWHVTSPGTINPGASATVALPDGRSVTATNQTQTTFNASDRATCYEDQTDGLFYLVGSGTGDTPDNMAIVSAYAESATDKCLWSGKIESISGVPAGYCTDQFAAGADCWLLVMNSQIGGESNTKVKLEVGEKYIGRHVADLSDVPVYAIRHEENEIYHYTISSPGSGGTGPIAIGGTANVQLADGRTVAAQNWTSDVLNTGDKCVIFHDLESTDTATWYIIKSASGNSVMSAYLPNDSPGIGFGQIGTVTVPALGINVEARNHTSLVDCTAEENVIVYYDTSAGEWAFIKGGEKSIQMWAVTTDDSVDPSDSINVTLPDAAGGGDVSAKNWSDQTIPAESRVYVIQDYGATVAGREWYLIRSGGGGAIWLRATANGTVTASDDEFSCLSAISLTPGVAAPDGAISVHNYLGLACLDADTVYIVQNPENGEYEAVSVQQHVYNHVVSLSYSAPNFTVTKRDFVGMANAAETTTTISIGGVSVTLVKDVTWDGTTLKKVSNNYHVISDDGGAATTTLFAITNVTLVNNVFFSSPDEKQSKSTVGVIGSSSAGDSTIWTGNTCT